MIEYFSDNLLTMLLAEMSPFLLDIMTILWCKNTLYVMPLAKQTLAAESGASFVTITETKETFSGISCRNIYEISKEMIVKLTPEGTDRF